MERVVGIATSYAQEACEVLFTEKEGGLRERRLYRPLDAIRNACMDVLDLQDSNQSFPKKAEFVGRYGRPHRALGGWWYAHLG
jgi:hypothetical protein